MEYWWSDLAGKEEEEEEDWTTVNRENILTGNFEN